MARRGPPKTNLPVERGAFVGRERLLQAIGKAIGDEHGPRVLVLVGPPGVGKTRLALRAVARELPRFGHEGGVWLVECLGAEDGAGIVRLVGLMLGLLPDPTADADAERARVAAVLGENGPVLVVIDGVDEVKDAVDAIAALARACPPARFVVTQRALIPPLPEVQCVTVPPLPTARRERDRDRHERPRPEDLSEAGQLFLERMGEARGSTARSMSAADLEAVQRIAHHLEGVPQAIELAAARCRVLSPAELLERLPRNLATLAPTRNKSALAGVVAWSLDLLQPWERAALAQCVIFHGGFTLEAARAVIDLSDVPHAPSVDVAIESLVEKALLKVVRADDDDEPRYDHPPAVRDLIVQVRPGARRPTPKTSTLELLPGGFSARSGEDSAETPRLELFTTREALVRRHATWVLARCGALKENVDGHGGLVARRRLEAEVENLLAVVRRSLSEEDASLAHVSQALLALAALEPILTTRGPQDLFRKLLDRALEPAETAGVPPALVARSLEMRARLRRAIGRLADARDDLERALALARRARDRLLEARALANLGTHALAMGELDVARRHYDDAITLMRAEGDRRLEARAIGFYGLLDEENDDLDEAARRYEEAIRLHAEVGDRRYEAIHQMQLARVRLARGDLDGARDLLRRALVLHRELQNRPREAQALMLGGDIAAAAGSVDDAVVAWTRAVPIARELGDPSARALLHARLAFAEERRGGDSRAHHEIVDDALRRIDDPQIVAAVGTLRGARMPARGVFVRAAERLVQHLRPQ